MSNRAAVPLAPMPFDEGAHPERAPWLVEQAAWTYLIPTLHEALARPLGSTRMPSWPTESAGHEDFRGYWETAIYLVVRLLGWADPQHGMKWFFDRGLADGGDPRLRLLREVWNSEGQLDLLAAWLWTPGSTLHLGSDNYDKEVPVAESWWRDFHDRFPVPDWEEPCRYRSGPYHGGTNALHLGHSLSGRWHPRPAVPLCVNEPARKASLVLEEMAGWYETLEASAGHLLGSPGGEWMVDVVVKPVGWLGCFRKSHITGRWYLGRHETHLAGNVAR